MPLCGKVSIRYHRCVGLLLLLVLAPICVVVVLWRWRIGRWLAVPAALATCAIIDAAPSTRTPTRA